MNDVRVRCEKAARDVLRRRSVGKVNGDVDVPKASAGARACARVGGGGRGLARPRVVAEYPAEVAAVLEALALRDQTAAELALRRRGAGAGAGAGARGAEA